MLEEDCSRERNSKCKGPGVRPGSGQGHDTPGWTGQGHSSTEAKDGHYKGKALSSSATSCHSPPSSFNSIDTSPLHALCGALAITDHQGSSVWVPRTLRPKRKATYPPTSQTALLSLNLLRHLPQGCEGQSDRTLQRAQEQKLDGPGLSHSGHTRRNFEQPKQSWKRRVKLEDSHFLIGDKAAGIKTVWYWLRGRHTDQSNRTQSPETNLCIMVE